MENKNKARIDVVIDAMNTLRFLCELDTNCNPRKISADVRNNDVLVYDHQYLWELCEEFDRMPEVKPIDFESQTKNEYEAFMYYRGVKFITYIDPEQKKFFDDRMAEYEQKLWESMENHDHDDDEE